MTTRDKVFEFICEYKRRYGGVNPSYEEIRTEIGLASKSTVGSHIANLIVDGRLKSHELEDNRRIWTVTGGMWVPPGQSFDLGELGESLNFSHTPQFEKLDTSDERQ